MLHDAYRTDPHMALGVALMLALASVLPLSAQGLDSEEAIETIVGSPVTEEQKQAAAEQESILSAIEDTLDNAAIVRKTSNVDKVDIVFLSDIVENGPPPNIEEALKKHKKEIEQLRQDIEGNALLFHAIDSRQVQMKSILAVEFGSDNGIKIYAAAKPPGQ